MRVVICVRPSLNKRSHYVASMVGNYAKWSIREVTQFQHLEPLPLWHSASCKKPEIVLYFPPKVTCVCIDASSHYALPMLENMSVYAKSSSGFFAATEVWQTTVPQCET